MTVLAFTGKMKVTKLLTDDHFKLFGSFYRVIDITPNGFGDLNVRAYKLSDPSHRVVLVLPRKTKIKVYNQKKL